jgi:DNA-binding LytR/AlgR family response regulator
VVTRRSDVPARALIVDDEAPARAELRHQLDGFDDVIVVGEATTAEEAEVLIASVGYDLIFLDIRMPGVGGVALGRQLARESDPPAVVFTTAFVDHAVEAFDLGATDYLVKPFDTERLRRAVDRALGATASRARDDGSEDVEPPAGAGDLQDGTGRDADEGGALAAEDDREGRSPTREGPVRIPVHRGDRIVLIEEPRIAFAEAARGYAYLTLVALPSGHPLAGADRLLSSHTLVDLEERFSDDFVRTHRSYLVNTRLVREVVRQVGGGLSLVMADRDRTLVPVARRQAAEVRQRLGV